MKKQILFFSALFSQAAALAASVPGTDPTKYNVCTVTIGSTEERDAFKRNLGNSKFNFIELTNLNGTSFEPRGWFDRACDSGIKCDVLTISAHFAGSFSNHGVPYKLSLDDMVGHSCRKDCRGILNNPTEVFMFSCNTMATTEIDSRGPEGYLNVLLEHGYLGPRSVEVVDLRYGSGTLIDLMKGIFSGSLHLYGFGSVGPSGQNVEGFLNQYFKRTGDYATHIKDEEAKRIATDLRTFNERMGNNDPLADAMSITNFAQCPASNEDDPVDMVLKNNVCQLMSRSAPVKQKLEHVKTLAEMNLFSKYQYYIKKYVLTSDLDTSDPEIGALVKEIKNQEGAKAEFIQAYKNQNSVVIRAEWASLGKRIGWIDDATFKDAKTQMTKYLLRQQKQKHSYNLICNEAKDVVDLPITASDIPYEMFNTDDGLRVLGCLNPSDPAIQTRLYDISQNSYGNLKSSAKYVLSDLRNVSKELLQKYVSQLKTKSNSQSDVREALEFLGRYVSRDPDYASAILLFLKSQNNASDLRVRAAQILGPQLGKDFNMGLRQEFETLKEFDPDPALKSVVADQIKRYSDKREEKWPDW